MAKALLVDVYKLLQLLINYFDITPNSTLNQQELFYKVSYVIQNSVLIIKKFESAQRKSKIESPSIN